MTKQDLREYYWIRRNISKLEDKLEELRTKATSTTSRLKNDQDAIQGKGNTSDKVGDGAAEIDKVTREIESQIRLSYKILSSVELAIRELPARESYLIRARYVELMSWERIAVDMNYSWQHIHRVHADALRLLVQEGSFK